MSLLSTASPWTNNSVSKKRIPTMKRATAKIKPYDRNNLEEVESHNIEGFSSIEETEKQNHENSQRVRELIDKLAAENDGSELSDFIPIDRPQLNSNSSEDIEKEFNYNQFDAEELLPKTLEKQDNTYSSNDSSLGNLTNYNNGYNNFSEISNHNVPYYAKLTSNSDNNKLIEKINYMIHLLEEQKFEKTANITEEFILYTFLGVFVIFIFDSFTRSGKYVR